MEISNILMLIGGLALFLHGMKMMSDGLEAAAGKRLKGILEKLTSNRLSGVLVGTGLTAVIQSSSATTVMAVGFVNAGIMTLSQAISVVMGANIGTTITGQMIALDIGMLAPAIAFIGVVLNMMGKKRILTNIGQIIAGLGILFVGMEMMGDAMKPLRDMPEFVNLLSSFENPLIGILVGAAFTAIIQSSSASIGILQALAASGVLGLGQAVFVLFGMNIGTCITSVIASVGANRNAKRVAIVHLLFNIIGTVLFTILCSTTQITDWVASWTVGNSVAQIANMHTLFNIVTTLILLPFAGLLAKAAFKILPGKSNEEGEMHLTYIGVGDAAVGSMSIAMTNLYKEVNQMFLYAKENVELAMEAVIYRDPKKQEKIGHNESYIDYLNTEITRYMTDITGMDMPPDDAKKLTALFGVTGNLERIGDHAENIFEYLERILEKKIEFSDQATEELVHLKEKLDEEFRIIGNWHLRRDEEIRQIAKMEQRIDDLTKEYRGHQIVRMRNKKCSTEAGVLYSELLTDVERIADHINNIAQSFNQAQIALTKE